MEGKKIRLNKCKKKRESLFTQLQALFEGLDDNRGRSAFSATEHRGRAQPLAAGVFRDEKSWNPMYLKQLIYQQQRLTGS